MSDSPREDRYEDECANCYHGASLHEWAGFAQPCTVPGCDCSDFEQPEAPE